MTSLPVQDGGQVRREQVRVRDFVNERLAAMGLGELAKVSKVDVGDAFVYVYLKKLGDVSDETLIESARKLVPAKYTLMGASPFCDMVTITLC